MYEHFNGFGHLERLLFSQLTSKMNSGPARHLGRKISSAPSVALEKKPIGKVRFRSFIDLPA